MNSPWHRALAAGAMSIFTAACAAAAPADKATAELYAARCQLCHGPAGRSPDPDRNLADDRWIHGNTLADAQRVIEDGVPGKAMLAFKDQLTPAQIAALARYVRSFGGVRKKTPPVAGKASP